ncbi:hypothetical protein [Dictyobacter arantiisoli]|uniref:Uncharacterized protein n=1 Tax=Dictyobacter arantiisoli TaxID=2014874 RepID=A0A5A5T9Q7_9CHLR|nr:hypothetical protein [Dictyobacter arantiisoli]GCF08128.1 hypothetical protein KDI_16920 [Dictyobacter arantiisoli]
MSFWYRFGQLCSVKRLTHVYEKKPSFVSSLVYGLCLVCFLSIMLVACSSGSAAPDTGGSGASSPVPTATPAPTDLAQLSWCGGKPDTLFRDQASAQVANAGKSTQLGPADGKPRTITDWNVVKANLGFTVYLPKTLPAGTCLLSVASSLRDPIFSSNFTATYVLPNQDSLSFSEAPMHAGYGSFQCNVTQDSSPSTSTGTASTATAGTATPTVTATATVGATTSATQKSLQLCSGVRDKTNIVFSSRGTTASLQQFFQALQPDVAWEPTK